MSAVLASSVKGINLSTRNFSMLCLFGVFSIALASSFDNSAFAETPQTTVTKIDDEKSLEKTVTVMSVPENNLLPWGSVSGKVNDPVQGYPVIIQFFKSIEDDPIHVAQVDLKGDNSYEYRFRVLSIEGDTVTHFFEGDYQVKIFKVVNTPVDNLDSA